MGERSSSVRGRDRSTKHVPSPLGPRPRRQGGPFDPTTLGRAAHEVVAALAGEGVRSAELERITLAVRAHPATHHTTARQQAARQWLMSATAMYFRLFVLPAGWDLLGAEVAGPRSVVDMAWRNRFGGDVLFDELKTGKAGDLVGGQRVDDQLDRQRRDGIEAHGERFAGIRLLVLAAPRRSFFVAPDGTRAPLFDGNWA